MLTSSCNSTRITTVHLQPRAQCETYMAPLKQMQGLHRDDETKEHIIMQTKGEETARILGRRRHVAGVPWGRICYLAPLGTPPPQMFEGYSEPRNSNISATIGIRPDIGRLVRSLADFDACSCSRSSRRSSSSASWRPRGSGSR